MSWQKWKSIVVRLCCCALLMIAPKSAIAETDFVPGLIFPTGIEPGDPSECEAPIGNSCWWVDADAAGGGDGSYASPYNSFDDVVGYFSGANNTGTYTAGEISGGDYLYIKGEFSGAEYEKTIVMARGSQGGTAAEPTVIKSWRSSPRAVLNGNGSRDDLIRISALDSNENGGVRIQNIELRNADGRGIYIDENVVSAEIVNVVVRDGEGDSVSGEGGAVVFKMNGFTTGGLNHDYTIRNSLIFNNDNNPGGGSLNNVGGVSIISTLQSGSPIVRIFNNIIHDEVRAIRHKTNVSGSGTLTMESYNNVIYGSKTAFYLRHRDNIIYRNLIFNVEDEAVRWEGQNGSGTANSEFYHNTVFNTPQLINTGDDSLTYALQFNVHDNAFVRQTAGPGVITLGESSSQTYSLNDWTSSYNLFYDASDSSFFVHQGVGHNFATAMSSSELDDATTDDQGADFIDSATSDFRLVDDISNPAKGSGTNGADIGALPVSCTGQSTIVPQDTTISSGVGNVFASGADLTTASNVVVTGDETNAVFRATKSINLDNGFHVKDGAQFAAVIDTFTCDL